MAVERKFPGIIDKPMSFCPGCGHGVISRIICECLEELGQDQNIIFPIGVGCSSNLGAGLTTDRLHCSHGRAAAVATGMKRVNPDNLVVTYQGDGDAYSIGLAESTNAAYRNENITVITVNNTNFGMTGGQMAPTTLVGMKASTAPKGRIPEEHGYPMHMCEILDKLTAPAYLVRTSCNTPQNVIKTKNAIKKAFQNQIDGKGFSMVEIVTSCPTNWGLEPLDALDFIEQKMLPEYPLGVIRDK